MENLQIKMENEIITEIKQLGAEIIINEYRPNGNLIKTKHYTKLRFAAKKLINHAQGYFPIYQNSSVMQMGYKMTISIN